MPLDVTKYDGDTLTKVQEALRPYATSERDMLDMIHSMENREILFREHAVGFSLGNPVVELAEENSRLQKEVADKVEEIHNLLDQLTELKKLYEPMKPLPAPVNLTELRQWAVEQLKDKVQASFLPKYAEELVNYVTTGTVRTEPPTNGDS